MGFDISTLKALALKGAVADFVQVSTKDLGRELGVSQQTASNRILALVEEGLITRKLGTRGQSVKLTREGLARLRKEYADYHSIFKAKHTIKVRGRVSTGLGEGEYYLKQAEYKDQFAAKLGFVPYEGTLNLKVSEDDYEKLSMVHSNAVEITGFKAKGRTFGAASCIPVKIQDVNCAIVLPKRTHHSDVIEVISAIHLRKKLDLKDGDYIVLDIN
jgi:riboflavin kinase